ncbi:MAG: deoxyribose-phosphate aldolase [Rikenellaceae bacterium]
MVTKSDIESVIASARLAIDGNRRAEVYKSIYSSLDVTTLSPHDTERSTTLFAEQVVETMNSHPGLPTVASICVYPPYVESVGMVIDGSPLRLTSVAGAFPSSQSFIEVKALEVAMAIESGADEIDIVMAVGRFLEGADDEVRAEIELLREEVGEDVTLKVIIESGELGSVESIYRASRLVIDCGADFVKSSTGKASVGATPEAVVAICSAIKDSGKMVGVKVAGGVRSGDDALLYYTIIQQVLGDEWLNPALMRFGASSLADELLDLLTNEK